MQVGANIPLYFQHPEGDATKYVQATVKKPDGTQVTGSPVNLAHVGNGQYKSLALVMPNVGHVVAQFLVYDDNAYTVRTEHQGVVTERFDLDPPSAGALAGATSNIIGMIENEENPAFRRGIQDTIVQGSDRTLLLRLILNGSGEPLDLAGATIIECRFTNEDGTVLSVKSTDAGSPVVATAPGAGKLTCALSAAQTALLRVASPTPFTIIMTKTTSVTICNLPSQLAVEPKVV